MPISSTDSNAVMPQRLPLFYCFRDAILNGCIKFEDEISLAALFPEAIWERQLYSKKTETGKRTADTKRKKKKKPSFKDDQSLAEMTRTFPCFNESVIPPQILFYG